VIGRSSPPEGEEGASVLEPTPNSFAIRRENINSNPQSNSPTVSNGPISKSERNELAKIVKARARVAKAKIEERSAQLLADFELQLDRKYSFDEDAVWKEATLAAEKAVREAQGRITERCRELGIPARFAPCLGKPSWYDRGENAVKQRRSELRRIAVVQIAAEEKKAKAAIEQASVEMQSDLVSRGLVSDEAKEFFARMPNPEALMPPIDIGRIERTFLGSLKPWQLEGEREL
jgi:hypothetical protein